jgi:Ca-activated chloride channel family protein
MITLDVSGSMQCFDNLQNRQQRIDVAKKEAARFIKKRLNDQIGIVIFGADAISRCPLTLDKNILQHIIHQTKLGIVNTSGTSLGTGIATAINKLKNSKAKNKIIILLTDGRPTPNTEQISVETAIKLAKEYKVKIYTIGIGNKNGGYINTSFGFVEKIPDSIDEGLLQKIASQTNGKFFRASSPVEMKKIYDTIDKLEKTKYQTQMFSKYYEAFASFFWGPTILLITELIIKIFLFKGI